VVPSLREARERGDEAWMRSAFGHFVRVRMLLAVGGALGVVLLGNSVLRVWLRRTDVAFGFAEWCALAVLMFATTWVTAHVELLMIMDRVWILVLLVLANAAGTITLTYLLAPAWGVLGVIAATAAVTTLVFTWLVPRLASSVLHVRERGPGLGRGTEPERE
jgi:O-antigen/teichoic acid export membrane protein